MSKLTNIQYLAKMSRLGCVFPRPCRVLDTQPILHIIKPNTVCVHKYQISRFSSESISPKHKYIKCVPAPKA